MVERILDVHLEGLVSSFKLAEIVQYFLDRKPKSKLSETRPYN